MPRIRSLHPDQWTDEDFVELSPMARLLCLGIRNLADDKGVFEWKPVSIKMKIFPGDNVDVVELLVELVSNRHVEKYEIDTKTYGAIRNFRKYQRPKNPNDIHPLPNSMRKYVGIDGEIAPADDVELPPKGEIAEQMEDGGDKGISLSYDKHVDFDDFWKSWPSKVSKATAQKAWASLSQQERREAVSTCSRWFSDWVKANPRASPIGASRFLSERRWHDLGEKPPEIDQKSKLAFYADLVNSEKYIAPSSLNGSLVGELLEAGLVTRQRLKERGIAA